MNFSTIPFPEVKTPNTKLAQPVTIGGPRKPFVEYAPNTTLAATNAQGPALPTEHDKLVKQAQRLVATTFFGAMLKQMRQSPFKTNITDGGRGGETFATMLDQHLAEKMARGAGSKLVNSIVRRLAKLAYEKQNQTAGDEDVTKKFNLRSLQQNQDRIQFSPESAGEALRTRSSHVSPAF